MSARRQPSSTSLSKYARIHSPILQNRSLDFCNSFWGFGDGGVDVLFARMRGAARTMEELKAFWKERASIEEDYAKRLAKLSKMHLGRDEIGDLRKSLDSVRAETDLQAGFHLNLAQQFRSEFEVPTTAFHARQLHHKKTYQAGIEKEFKTKQTQETYVNKAREKYEQDCVRINSFTAQASLVQGKDLEKINLKLERTQQTVQTNEREFSNFSKALQETVMKWEQDWKSFCDSCQDMEEDRMDFMKDNLWNYANAVSTVCVADDASCESIRVALEQMEVEKDIENFVRDYGTGNQIPDPPAFVNYQAPDAIPSSSARPTSHAAQFNRSTSREIPLRQHSMPPEEEPPVNTAGIGAGGGAMVSKRIDPYANESVVDVSRQPTRSTTISNQPQIIPYTNGTSNHNHAGPGTSPSNAAPSPNQPTRRQSTLSSPLAHEQHQQLQRVLQDPYAEPIDPNAETFIKVGNHAYKVDLSNDPQQRQQPGPPSSIRQTTQNQLATSPNGDVDPLMKQLEELKNAVSSSGSVRRNKARQSSIAEPQQQKPTHVSSLSSSSRAAATGGAASSSLSLPTQGSSLAVNSSPSGQQQRRSPSPARDYRNSAENVVGAYPSASRPASPNPPTAAFMVPKSAQPAGAEVVQEVLADYHQSLPGERKSISRSNSTRGHAPSLSQVSIGGGGGGAPSPAAQGQNLARPPSQLGHAGIGAHGSRSNSPQPISRGPSPAPSQVKSSFIQPPVQVGQALARTPSPNAVGIALDPTGRVLHDDMAHRYQQQQQHQPPPPHHSQPQQQPVYNPPPPMIQQQQMAPPPQQQPVQQQRRNSYIGPLRSNTIAPPIASQTYGVSPPPPAMYQAPSPQPGYLQQQQQPAPVYNAPPPVQYQPPPQQQQPRYNANPQQQQQQQQQQVGYGSVNGLQRNASSVTANSGSYYGNIAPLQQQQIQPVQQQQQMLAVQQQQQRIAQQTQQAQQQQQRAYQQQQAQSLIYHDPNPTRRSPSPQPPPQTTDDGDDVQFYVKALYDYTATIEEEFDFQAGDIIAVTATPEDGWWSGELLDEARRQKGRNVFPSNFVCLF